MKEEEGKERLKIKVEKEAEDKHLPDPNAGGGGAKQDSGMGRLVMTVDGQQKQLPFCPNDLLSTATMFDGDRVRLCRRLPVSGPRPENTNVSPVLLLRRFALTSPPTQRPKRRGPPTWRSSQSPLRSPTSSGNM